MTKLQKFIFILFAILLFFVPLILWPFTSEVFEFNKMVLVYTLTVLIISAWLVRMVLTSKIIFRRTILDIPLLVFIGSQLASTLFSIDPLTSWLGYYSRFNGGLVSIICYSLLYWAFVSNFGKKETLKLLYVWLTSAALVSIYGVMEHFGIDKSIWVQDVQSRVFSTLGQPNWLAAWLVALLPVTWALVLESGISNLEFRLKNKNFWIYFALSILFFWTLIFTKSRSGFLGFGVAFLIFWGYYFWSNRNQYKKILVPFGLITISLFLISLISGTQWSPSIREIISHQDSRFQIPDSKSGPALETGGTESGTIRRIVWTGAVQVWLHYPIFGTGVETFAYSYYLYRPAEHNMTSEWDFIYNKAHNEYLNFAANTGTAGLLSYLILIGFIFYQILDLKSQNLNLATAGHKITIFQNSKPEKISDLSFKFDICNLRFALLAGYVSLLATNFFGFSVVPTQLQFFLFPAMAIGLVSSDKKLAISKQNVSNSQKVLIFATLIATGYILITISKYWYADTLYAKGVAYNSISRPDTATKYLTQAISLEPNQAKFHSDLADSYKTIALSFNQQKDTENTKKFTDLAISESNLSISLSPANVNLRRSLFGVYVTLATINPNYLLNARDVLVAALPFAPTHAKLYYNLGLVYARTGQLDEALAALKKTIEIKPDYKEARLAYAILLIDKKQNAEAKVQLEYILMRIDPNDSLTKQTLESIK